ncbi:variant erythrocyte surface antigen-1 family protein [Babesia caballi]|uniref:Variant erythrocyte surface antigen-1 family protein n=1 Tax=Babesia caballi TaxID=5871 RepID=A0AAV4LYM2_BABCB|nr:variant erythrocyte surface antigen-1 family protein [Babesia caballi]
MAAAFETNLQNIFPDSADNVAEKVGKYLKAVYKSNNSKGWDNSSADGVDQNLKTLVKDFNDTKPYNPSDRSFSGNIGQVQSALKVGSHPTVHSILDSGKNAFMAVLKITNYTRMNYEAASSIQWNRETAKVQTCAKIFLGCLPLYYQALTYIYWGCREGGPWRNLTVASGAMRSYFDSQGLLPLYVERSKTGAHIADSALKGFSEFQQGMSEASSPSTFPYVTFTNKLREEVTKDSNGLSSKCPLSALFYGASCYFRYRQITNAKLAFNTPKTIREMLYFLAALQFSPQYDELNNHIGTLLNTELSVADSSDTKPNNTLSADQLKEYLRGSCASSSCVLGMVQGPGASESTSDPWLFELFSNTDFQFKYSAGSALFNALSNYAYACQFQLLFLYSMCGNIGLKCGWQECTYGKEMNPKASDNSLQSHICQGLKCNGDTSCKHNGTGGTNCNHNNYSDNAGCGKGSNPSPPGVSHWNASVIWP